MEKLKHFIFQIVDSCISISRYCTGNLVRKYCSFRNAESLCPNWRLHHTERKDYNMFLNKLFGKVKNKNCQNQPDTKAAPQIEPQTKPVETETAAKPAKPDLNQYVTFGRNGNGETAEVVLSDLEHGYRKVIINHDGFFEDFPGIVQGRWTNYLEGKFNFDAGHVLYRTSFEKHEDGYRCLWEIQPDGRYWADEDEFGAEDDSEIILYADLDGRGVFKGPFRIYKIDGRRVEKPDEKEQPEDQRTLEQLVPDALEKLLILLNEKMPDTGKFDPISFGFRVPNSCYIACISVEASALYENKRLMKVFVVKEYSNRAYNHYYKHLASDEMKEYIQNGETAAEVIRSIRQLTKSD